MLATWSKGHVEGQLKSVYNSAEKPSQTQALFLVPCVRTGELAPPIWMMPPPHPISKLGVWRTMTEGKQVFLQEFD